MDFAYAIAIVEIVEGTVLILGAAEKGTLTELGNVKRENSKVIHFQITFDCKDELPEIQVQAYLTQ